MWLGSSFEIALTILGSTGAKIQQVKEEVLRALYLIATKLVCNCLLGGPSKHIIFTFHNVSCWHGCSLVLRLGLSVINHAS